MSISFCECRSSIPIQWQVQGHHERSVPLWKVLVKINPMHVNDINFVAAKCFLQCFLKPAPRFDLRTFVENTFWNRNGNEQTIASRSRGSNNEGPMPLLHEHSI